MNENNVFGMAPQQPRPSSQLVQMPVRDAATAQQVNTVLGVLGMSMSALGHFARSDFDEDATRAQTMNRIAGEARIAAELTFIAACDTLQDILKDADRWSLKHSGLDAKQITQQHKAHMRFLRAQAAASEELTTPHFRYRPTIARLVSGKWLAFLGDPENLENAISGEGDSPGEAVLAFDAKFNGELPSPLVEWLEQREHALEEGLPTEPFPQQNTHEQNLDAGTDSATDTTKTGGDAGQDDSDDPGAGLPADNG